MQTLILQVWVGPTFLKFPGDTVHLPEVYTLRSKALVNHNGLLTVSGEGNGTPLQYSCLENPMDGGAWWATVHGVAKSRTQLSDFHFHFSLSCIGKGNGNPLQCSCLESPGDGGAWWAAVYGVAQSRTQLKCLSSSSNAYLKTLSKNFRGRNTFKLILGDHHHPDTKIRQINT